MAETSYSVWLVPEGSVRDRLREQIAALARATVTPAFEPHVTLIGLGSVADARRNDMLAQVAALAARLSPLPIALRELGMRDSYFRSLYLTVEPTEEVLRSGALGVELYRALKTTGPADPNYFPHLSLLYGDLPRDAKERLVATDLSSLRPGDLGFVARRLELWVTSGPVSDWRLVQAFHLGPPAVERPPGR